jgi:hypothetical protein
MFFNPLSNRDPHKKIDETDWFGGTLLLAALLLLAGFCFMKVKVRDIEMNYIQQNNCKIEQDKIENTNNYKMTLWVCNNGKHYVTK